MSCKLKTICFWAGAMLSMVTASASASAIYTFSGKVSVASSSGNAPTDAILNGDTIAGRLVYDPSAMNPGITDGEKQPIAQLSMSNGSASWGSTFGFYNVNSISGLGGYNIVSGSLSAPGVTSGPHHDDEQALFAIPGVLDPVALASDPAGIASLPNELNLSEFSGGSFEWSFYFPHFYEADAGNQLFIEGSVDRIARVSEPGSFVLLAIGLAAFARGPKRAV